jgi:ribosomal-protein-alanine N-acetyltransferase
MGRFSRGGSFIPEERACFLPLDFAVVAGGKAVGGVGFVLGTDVERFGANGQLGREMQRLSAVSPNNYTFTDVAELDVTDAGAVRQAVEWMFANTPIIRIFAAAYATNSASQRVLVKAGFRHVGTFRKAFFKNGAFVDGCYYELLKDENE